MRSEYSANLAMQSQTRDDWRAVLEKRDANRAKRHAQVAQAPRAMSFPSMYVSAHVNEIQTMLADMSTLPGVSGTAWGLVNAVTEYVDHHASAKSTDHRADSAFFGKGDDLKTAALNQALAMV